MVMSAYTYPSGTLVEPHMIAGRIAQFAAFGTLVASLIVAFPDGGTAKPFGVIGPCSSKNFITSYVKNATNPTITKPAGGGFDFTATSSVTFDCSDSTVTPSGCGICTYTQWTSGVAR